MTTTTNPTTEKEITMTTETAIYIAPDRIQNQMDIDGVEPPKNELAERCPDCGRTSEEGACFYCKMD